MSVVKTVFSRILVDIYVLEGFLNKQIFYIKTKVLCVYATTVSIKMSTYFTAECSADAEKF